MLKPLACLVSIAALKHFNSFVIIILGRIMLCISVKYLIFPAQFIRDTLCFRCYSILCFWLNFCRCLDRLRFFLRSCRLCHLCDLSLLFHEKILQFFSVETDTDSYSSCSCHNNSSGNTHPSLSAAHFVTAFLSGCPSGFICTIVIIKEILVLTCCRRFFIYICVLRRFCI